MASKRKVKHEDVSQLIIEIWKNIYVECFYNYFHKVRLQTSIWENIHTITRNMHAISTIIDPITRICSFMAPNNVPIAQEQAVAMLAMFKIIGVFHEVLSFSIVLLNKMVNLQVKYFSSRCSPRCYINTTRWDNISTFD